MLNQQLLATAAVLLLAVPPTADAQSSASGSSLTLVPPSPVSSRVKLDIRGAIHNPTSRKARYTVSLHWDRAAPETLIKTEKVTLKPKQRHLVRCHTPTSAHVGERRIIMTVETGGKRSQVSRPITVLDAKTRSTGKIGGAWLGFYHWSESEGAPWNPELKKMTARQWKELVRAMHEVDMNVIVLQEVFRHEAKVGAHSLTVENYPGKAFYPSKLYPGRMPIATKDPIDAVLTEADRLGMHVFMGVGSFAWFDFGPESLRWHQRVADELWQRYGHHKSFYGWYVSEEIEGGLSAGVRNNALARTRHKQIVHFFKEFKSHVSRHAPDKPVMLATNSHHIEAGKHVYPKLLKHLDILCPFGFHRMPANDTTGEVAAARLQKFCNDAGSHLWMDMEVFDFGKNGLIPRSIEGLVDDLNRFPVFEKTLCYQFPGLMNAPWMSRHPGGPETVKLYEAYKKRLKAGKLVNAPTGHQARGLAYNLGKQPSDKYPGEGASPLTDGWLGSSSYRHRAWVGFQGEPLDLTLDFPGKKQIDSVEIGFLQDHASGIFLPKTVKVGVSTNDRDYRWTEARLSAKAAAPGSGRHVFSAKLKKTAAKHLRVTSSNPGAGDKTWTFVDEVLVR